MIKVTLTSAELMVGAVTGIMRHVSSLQKRRQDRHGFVGDGWGIHVEGACGEMAFAKAMDRYWTASVNAFKGADVGDNIQVKTRSRHSYDLIVRKDDDPDHVFFLVTGLAPDYRVHGWIVGRDAMQNKWLQTYGGRPPAWFVPQDALHNLDAYAKERDCE